MAVAATAAYWLDTTGDGSSTIWTAPLDGSSPPSPFASDDFTVDDFAIDGTAMYWSDVTSLWRQPLAGGSAVRIAATFADCIVADATNLYFTQGGGGVFTVAK